MKNLINRTKNFTTFNGLKLKLTDETAAILIGGKLVGIGLKARLQGNLVRVCFGSDEEQKSALRWRDIDKTAYFRGKKKGDVYFIYGWTQHTRRKRSLAQTIACREASERIEVDDAKCFTGYQRSGDRTWGGQN